MGLLHLLAREVLHFQVTHRTFMIKFWVRLFFFCIISSVVLSIYNRWRLMALVFTTPLVLLAPFLMEAWTKAPASAPPTPNYRKSLLHEFFKASTLPNSMKAANGKLETDYLVIGSGMSGLSCAAMLSQTGKRVLVVEKHKDMCGGGTHTYVLGNGYKFDSGLHYTVPQSEMLLQVACGTPHSPVRFELLGDKKEGNDGTFDWVMLGLDYDGKTDSKSIKFPIKHAEAHLKDLAEEFPEDAESIKEFLFHSDIAMMLFPLFMVSKLLPSSIRTLYNRYILNPLGWEKYAGATAQELFTKLIPNGKLSSILLGLWIDTGCPPTRASFALNCSVFRGLPLEGGAYPAGGSDAMAKALVTTIEENGGKVYCRGGVEEILVEGNKVTGVRMEDGTTINCSTVVSAAGYFNTYHKMLPAELAKKHGHSYPLKKVPQSDGFVMVNLGIKAKPAEVGITCTNIWWQPVGKSNDYNMYESLDKFFEKPLEHESAPMMITFPSMKDRDWEAVRKGNDEKISCQILIPAPGAWFAKWKGTAHGNRGADYEELKQQWLEKGLGVMMQAFPKLTRDMIELADVSTPLSIEEWLEEPSGGAIGLDVVPERFVNEDIIRALDMKTPIDGLWMTGQDTIICGQPIVQAAGIMTALRISPLSCGKLIFNQLLDALPHFFRVNLF